MGVAAVAGDGVRAGFRVQGSGFRAAGRLSWLATLLGMSVAVGGAAGAQTVSTLDPRPSNLETHVLVVAGMGADARYARQFTETGVALRDALAARLGRDSLIVLLAEDPSRAPAKISGRSTRERVIGELAALVGRSRAGDQVVILMLGHGSPGADPKLNLPGPDLAASALAAALDALPGRRIAVINAASASGDFVKPLAAAGRVVITATKSGYERNETRFAKHLADALGKGASDTDKDGRLSLLEAFEYARRETARSYETEKRIATEHAVLAGDSALARWMVLEGAGFRVQGSGFSESPRLASLRRVRDSLQAEVQGLAARKSVMSTPAYERALEDLLVKLARASEAVREVERAP